MYGYRRLNNPRFPPPPRPVFKPGRGALGSGYRRLVPVRFEAAFLTTPPPIWGDSCRGQRLLRVSLRGWRGGVDRGLAGGLPRAG